MGGFLRGRCILIPALLVLSFVGLVRGASVGYSFQIVTELANIKNILGQVGPILSAVMFIIAGVFYALGQIMPPDKKANFHSTAVNIIIGAIVVGVLSVAATSFATASTHLLSNMTLNSSQ
jgi:hypothetical protein